MTQAIQALLVDPEIKKALEAYTPTGLSSSVIVDLGVLRTAIIAALTALDAHAVVLNAQATRVNATGTKLNADAGVTDTDYGTNLATNTATTNVSGSTPAAMTTV